MRSCRCSCRTPDGARSIGVERFGPDFWAGTQSPYHDGTVHQGAIRHEHRGLCEADPRSIDTVHARPRHPLGRPARRPGARRHRPIWRRDGASVGRGHRRIGHPRVDVAVRIAPGHSPGPRHGRRRRDPRRRRHPAGFRCADHGACPGCGGQPCRCRPGHRRRRVDRRLHGCRTPDDVRAVGDAVPDLCPKGRGRRGHGHRRTTDSRRI